jgi:hypothetical protein
MQGGPPNGGSSPLVFGTEELPVGGKNPADKHPSPDEVLYFANGKARLIGGERRGKRTPERQY